MRWWETWHTAERENAADFLPLVRTAAVRGTDHFGVVLTSPRWRRFWPPTLPMMRFAARAGGWNRSGASGRRRYGGGCG
jgi:hypothetical protein